MSRVQDQQKAIQLIQKKDLLLLLIIFSSIGVGIEFPNVGKGFIPYLLQFMMFLLFFSFLKIEFAQVLKNIRKTTSQIFVLCSFKLLILPIGLFFFAQAVWPQYAVPVLLLSGISTGVTAPFISSLLNASTLPVLMMVVISSFLVPFSLPALVSALIGRSFEISFLSMVKTLAMVVFLPAVGAILLRRGSPLALRKLEKAEFPVSLVIFACTNLGVFSKYSSFFNERPVELAGTILVAFILSILYHLAGFLVTWGRKKEDRLAGAISFAYMNNILVMVFSSEFFGPLSVALAAMYLLPFFTMIVPARIFGDIFK